MRAAFGPALASDIAAGDQAALLRGLSATAALWFLLADSHVAFRRDVGAAQCVADGSPARGALLAAARDLCAVLELSPQGREALADLARDPVLQKPESE